MNEHLHRALERSSTWKKFLTIGAVLLTVIIVLINLPGTKDQELSAVGWSLMMVSFLASFTLIGAGIVLGAAQLLAGRNG